MGSAALRHVRSSPTKARTRVPCIGRQTTHHCATREALHFIFFTSSLLLQVEPPVEKFGYDLLDSFNQKLLSKKRWPDCFALSRFLRPGVFPGRGFSVMEQVSQGFSTILDSPQAVGQHLLLYNIATFLP